MVLSPRPCTHLYVCSSSSQCPHISHGFADEKDGLWETKSPTPQWFEESQLALAPKSRMHDPMPALSLTGWCSFMSLSILPFFFVSLSIHREVDKITAALLLVVARGHACKKSHT